jgi:pimeloyl-[acyl-carrier protein] methyl ester esterase
MSLYVGQAGHGPDLVLIHGWGAHGGIWSELLAKLVDSFRVHVIDLPGLGRSPAMDKEFTLESVIDEIRAVTPGSAIWMGWSLGALIVLALAASDKDRVQKIILAGASPCFSRKQDWQWATEAGVLHNFARLLQSDYQKTLIRFLSLQMGEGAEARRVLRVQRNLLFQYGQPDITTLGEMLDVLQQTDLRELLANIDQAALLIHGNRDTLAPLAAAEYLHDHLPDSALLKIDGAGHIPFLTHTDLCARKIKTFCQPG